MSAIGEQVGDAHSARPPVAQILRAYGRILTAAMTLSWLAAFGSYRAFDFDLIWVVAIPLAVGGIGLTVVVARSDGRGDQPSHQVDRFPVP